MHMDIPKRLYYEVISVIIMDFLVADSGRAAKSGKIIVRSAAFGSFWP